LPSRWECNKAARAVCGVRCRPIAVGHTAAVGVVVRIAGLARGLLRKAWLNVDWLWAGALLVTGIIVLVK
jgi:hypothetical protein